MTEFLIDLLEWIALDGLLGDDAHDLTSSITRRVACAFVREKAPGFALARARPCPGRRRTPRLIGSAEDLTGERR